MFNFIKELFCYYDIFDHIDLKKNRFTLHRRAPSDFALDPMFIISFTISSKISPGTFLAWHSVWLSHYSISSQVVMSFGPSILLVSLKSNFY